MERGLSPCPLWAVFVISLAGRRQQGLALKGRRISCGVFFFSSLFPSVLRRDWGSRTVPPSCYFLSPPTQ